jgi:subtilisin family serine protease
MVRRSTAVAALALGSLAACSSDSVAPLAPSAPSLAKNSSGEQKYVVQFAGDETPAAFASRIAALGGRVDVSLDGAGVAVVSASRADFRAAAQRIAGVASVTPDITVQWIDPNGRVVDAEDVAEAAAVNPTNDRFYPAQWSLDAIDAPEAWATGATGAGARVAILDGGIYAQHPDLNDNIDVARSRSFAYAGNVLTPFDSDVGTFWHGTHVAGIVAAEDNDIGVVGVAPKATLIGVKVLHAGSGAFSWVLNGMYYASTPIAAGGAGADIINMSLGAVIPAKGETKADKEEIKELLKAFDRAAKYANKNGTTVIAAAGNDALNFDAEAKDSVSIPGGSKHVIGVSSTAPLGWGLGNTDFSRQASYTNIGKQLVDLAAPGGDFALPGNDICQYLRSDGTPGLQFCWALDMVLSTTRAGYSWAAGTSMASPTAAGVAALVVAQNGGDMHPAQLEAALQQSAIDLGKPGKDAVYGHGWVNAYRAVTGTNGSVIAAK